MPDLTTNLNLIKPLGSEVAELWAGAGQAEQNKTIIDTYTARPSLTDYTPVLTASSTNPNLGSTANVIGRWTQLQNGLVYGWAKLEAGGTGINAGSGTYEISLPVAFDTAFHPISNPLENKHILGNGFIRDQSSAFASMPVALIAGLSGSSTVRMITHTFTGKTVVNVTSSQPFTLATGDSFSVRFLYKAVV